MNVALEDPEDHNPADCSLQSMILCIIWYLWLLQLWMADKNI